MKHNQSQTRTYIYAWFGILSLIIIMLIVGISQAASSQEQSAFSALSNTIIGRISVTESQLAERQNTQIYLPVIHNDPMPEPTPTPTPTEETPDPIEDPTIEPGAPLNAIYLNVGSSNDYSDGNAIVWRADYGFIGGRTSDYGDIFVENGDSEIYKTERWGMEAYRLPLDNGIYEVTLMFMEGYLGITGPEQRIFEVIVEGNSLGQIDPYKLAGGRNIAIPVSTNVPVEDGELSIEFISIIENPEINGIQIKMIEQLPETTPTPVPSTPVGTPTETPTETPSPEATSTATPTTAPTVTPIPPQPSPTTEPGSTIGRFVAPNGSDSNDGTFDSPWKTINHAIKQLSPGDTLNLRGGIYYENNLTIRTRGSENAPITIQSYPSESAIIDGGIPDYRLNQNGSWELVNSGTQLYRSREKYGPSTVRAWLVNEGIQLFEYNNFANLSAEYYGPVRGTTPLYHGPGVHHGSDGYIYIRLTPNPNDLTDSQGNTIAPVPSNPNPNQHDISIFSSERIFILDNAAYLHFNNLTFSNSIRAMDIRNSSNYVRLTNSQINYGTYGLIIRDGIRGWVIENNEFNNGLPDWVYWTDVKNRSEEAAEGYPEFQSTAIDGAMTDFKIQHNHFHHSFDGMQVEDGTQNAKIMHNTFTDLRDDAINLRRGIRDVEVAHNMMWKVGAGMSNLGSDASAGHVYIHHNVIDNSPYQRGGRVGNYREGDWPVWMVIDPFANHDGGNKKSWWKLYNNTIVSRRGGYDWQSTGPFPVEANPELYIYNNIFYVLDDRIIFKNDRAGSGAHYDGNVIYQAEPSSRFPLLMNFGDGGDYTSLEDFRRNSGTNWEAKGLQTDPQYKACLLEDPNLNLNTLWDRYRPGNSQILTQGVSYNGYDWPETNGINYRGALGQSSEGSPACP